MDEEAQWLATGTFLDTLNANITKLSEAVDRNTAVASSLDKRLVLLEEKDKQRDLEQLRLAAEFAQKKSAVTAFKEISNHIGEWLWKQRVNPLVVVPATAIVLKYFPAMSAILIEGLKLLLG